jgi:hypothetical protein
MRDLKRMAVVLAIVAAVPGAAAWAVDPDLLPPQLTKDQREHLLRFLQRHEKPERYLPRDAKVIGTLPIAPAADDRAPAAPVKQYMVQITPHRPVPGHEQVTRADVYYYRPNPEQGKPGITVKHTVDLTTGNQVGPTEVLPNHHSPLSREELAEAVALARTKSPALQALYKARGRAVHWEYLQLLVSRKRPPHEPGDRVARFVFTAPAAQEQALPDRVTVVVNLTKQVVAPDSR